MSAIAHSRSTIACSSGASSGETSRARMAAMASLSEKYHWPSPSATAMNTTLIEAAPAVMRNGHAP